MFEISRQPLITEVRCQKCRSSIEVNSDSRRMVEKSVTEFRKRHHRRPVGASIGGKIGAVQG